MCVCVCACAFMCMHVCGYMLKIDFSEVMAHHRRQYKYEVGTLGTIITSTLQIRKLRLRGDKQLVKLLCKGSHHSNAALSGSRNSALTIHCALHSPGKIQSPLALSVPRSSCLPPAPSESHSALSYPTRTKQKNK